MSWLYGILEATAFTIGLCGLVGGVLFLAAMLGVS